MAKENEMNQPRSHRDVWLENMRKKYPDIQDEDALYEASMNGYDAEHDAAKRYREEVDDFASIISETPDLASVASALFDKNERLRLPKALRELPEELKRYTNDPEYGDEEYMADRQKRLDEEKAENERAAREKELWKETCDEVLFDEEKLSEEEATEILNQLNAIVTDPCETKEQCKVKLRTLLKMINYDAAVAAAETKGRNANIEEQRRNVPTSTPKGGAGVTTASNPKRARSIFDEARDAE